MQAHRMRYKVSDNFYLDEFVPVNIYKEYGQSSLRFINPKAIIAAQTFRNITDRPGIINNWFKGGSYQYSGYRPVEYKKGAKRSMHKILGAFDYKCAGMTSFEMHDILMDHEHLFYRIGVRRVENPEYTQGNRDWLHVDFANTDMNRIQTFIP